MAREKGTGSYYRDTTAKKVRWIGEITLGGKRHRVSAGTKTDAKAKVKALVVKYGSGAPLEDRRVTVADVVDAFMERELPNMTRNGQPLAPSTQETYTWAADVVRRDLGKVRLADLTVGRVETFLDDLAEGGLSKASLVKMRSKLGQFIAFAERRGQVGRNVAKLAVLPPTAKATEKRRSLSPDDARTLLAVLRATRNGAMYALSLTLGLRPGEAAGLFWEDLRLDDDPPTLNVTRGVQLTRGAAGISDDLKTTASKRTLELSPDMVAWLRDHRRAQLEERLAADRWLDDRLVFASPTGRVLDPKALRTMLAEVCETAEVPKMRPNELRHSCASLLADEGVPNELIADLLGHSTTRMVEQTYKHRLRPVVSVAAHAVWTGSADAQ